MKHPLIATITIAIPHASLSPNSRVHWRTHAKHKKISREGAYLAALASPLRGAMFEQAFEQATYFTTTKRRRDGDNFLARLKHAFDGIAQAGVIKDDSGFTHRPVIFKIDKLNPRVEIVIEKIEQGLAGGAT